MRIHIGHEGLATLWVTRKFEPLLTVGQRVAAGWWALHGNQFRFAAPFVRDAQADAAARSHYHCDAQRYQSSEAHHGLSDDQVLRARCGGRAYALAGPDLLCSSRGGFVCLAERTLTLAASVFRLGCALVSTRGRDGYRCNQVLDVLSPSGRLLSAEADRDRLAFVNSSNYIDNEADSRPSTVPFNGHAACIRCDVRVEYATYCRHYYKQCPGVFWCCHCRPRTPPLACAHGAR